MLGVPCITLRNETEWVETVEVGWNMLVGADTEDIVRAIREFAPPKIKVMLYGDGQSTALIVDILTSKMH